MHVERVADDRYGRETVVEFPIVMTARCESTSVTESYLAVADFSGGVANTGKIGRHFGPLADHADTTLVCLDPDEGVEGITYRPVPTFGFRPLGLLVLFAVALVEAARNDYDGVLSISLVPYGCFALAIGRLHGLPVHLGIIGADLDVHAHARYGSVVRLLLGRFDAISVPGTDHGRQLERLGVPSERIAVLTNAIDIDTYRPADDVPTEYDCIWVGRFTAEKDPLLFVEALAALDRQGRSLRAVMLGSGPLLRAVKDRVRERGLEEQVELPGWVDEPVEYYRCSRLFVLTSERDALPLTMLEAMATGLACVVPDVGNIDTVVTDGENGVIVDTRDAASFAAEIQWLRTDDDRYERIATNAPATGSRFSYERATDDWKEILRTLHTA
jgi:glycosyltransferase involved in cell wall biosynthesis